MTTDTMTTETTETTRTATGTAATDGTSTQPTQQDASGPFPTETPRGTPRDRTQRKRWVELVAAAAIAAVVGSGATLALTEPAPSETAPLAATRTAQPGTGSPNTAGAGQDWTSVAAKASPAVVAISVEGPQGGGEGSGVVWDAQGNIVTNNHVVASAGRGGTVQVRIGAQSTYEAKVVGTDPTTDLAVARLVSPPTELTAIGRANADSLQVGDPVMALGNPLGLSGTVTTGIVSALDRPVTTRAVTDSGAQGGQGIAPAAASSQQVVTDAIQTSAAINPGNSGGALVDAAGDLVGINSSIASLSSGQGQAGNIGIGFAIPVQEVQTVVGQLLADGTVAHASLGVSVVDATLSKGTATIAGAGIEGVTAGSAAAEAGLSTGDVVTAVDGRPVDSAEGLVARVRGLAVGEEVRLTVTGSNAQERTVTATLAARS